MKKIVALIAFLLLIPFFTYYAFAQNKNVLTQVQVEPALPELPIFQAGEEVFIGNPVNRDLFAAGSRVIINSPVNGDAYIAGGNIEINSPIAGDLIVAGGTVTINSRIGKNLIVAGGNVTLTQSAAVASYCLAGGNNILINGTIDGSFKAYANHLSISDTGRIAGHLEADVSTVDISDAAVIIGERRITRHESRTPPQVQRPRGIEQPIIPLILNLIGKIIILSLLIRLLNRLLVAFVKPAFNSILKTVLWGFVVLVLTPILVLLLLITVVGIPLALILTIIYGLSIYLSSLFTSLSLAYWFQTKSYFKNQVYLQAIIALIVLTVISWIPFLGPIIGLISLLLGLGLVFLALRSALSRE